MHNHLGEATQQTYSGWRAACRRAFPNGSMIGNKDIGGWYIVDVQVGEWDGAEGSVFKDDQVARVLAKQINTATHYTPMQRSTVSMTLSGVLQRLGAQGVDNATAASTQEGEADE